jgi:hypothetical protein
MCVVVQIRVDCCYRHQPCADRRWEISDAHGHHGQLKFGSHLACRKDPRSPVGSSFGSLPSSRAPEGITLSIRIRQLSLSTDGKTYLGSLLEDVTAVVQHCPRAKRQPRCGSRQCHSAEKVPHPFVETVLLGRRCPFALSDVSTVISYFVELF